MDDDTKPELDPTRRKALQDAHYASQVFRWDRAGRKLTERKRAELLAEIELDVLWDGLTDIEREKAVKDVGEDRDWPGLFDKLAAESAKGSCQNNVKVCWGWWRRCGCGRRSGDRRAVSGVGGRA